ncbi:DoxX family protein [Gaopeijia maritima]|uniref:DoxX family protein n=1 Tax=Gaopeijia maritima TaxID=3119007 RepID=UPI003246A0AE
MSALPRLGQLLYAVPMAIFGLMHLMMGEMMAGAVPIPGGVLWVYLTGVALLLAAGAIITGKQAANAALGLAVFLLLTALMVHLPALMGGDQAAMGQVLKDIALAGGALILFGAVRGPDSA